MKRKFKILILAVSVIAMLLAFAITSSAMSRDLTEVRDDYWYIYDIETSMYYGVVYEGSNSLMEVTLDYVGILNNGAEALIEDIIEDLENDPTNGRYSLPHEGSSSEFEFEEVFSAVIEKLTNFKTFLEKKYSQSDIDNEVDKYKSSEEYALILNNKYLTGYTEGMESFKSSDAYTNALDLQYSNGKTAGVTEYKSSTEYANALKAEYDEGYDNGVTDTRGENTKNDTTKLISILIGVLGFGILCMGVFSAVSTFKKKRAKRR